MINEHLFNGVAFEKIPECFRKKYKEENPSKRERKVNGHKELLRLASHVV